MSGRGLGARRRARLSAALIFILASTFLVRLIRLNQPIVENYVGRQIPTAMVARNLEHGSGFLRPQLDTGPFPNYFMVEPPLYEQLMIGIARAYGTSHPESGRLLSAFGITLAAGGLFELVRRREGGSVALASVLAFSAFPVTIRYGRACQPDALMLGFMILGTACWDQRSAREGRRRLVPQVAGWFLIATGLALKITSAYLLVPCVACLGVRRANPTEPPESTGWMRRAALTASTLLPALVWYVWAGRLVSLGEGSRASVDNRTIWLQALASTALFTQPVWRSIGRFLLWRCFTPLAPVLAALGVWDRLQVGRSTGRPEPAPTRAFGAGDPTVAIAPAVGWNLWVVWGASASAALLALAAKLHHEYYWLAIAPVMAVGVGSGLFALESRRRGWGWIVGAVFVGLCGLQSRSTWETPPEWRRLEEAARLIQAVVTPDALIVAPEALIYYGERRGCRLETTPSGCRRAAGEWGARLNRDSALELVALYAAAGARYFADVGSSAETPVVGGGRSDLHEAIRRRYKVIVDLPAVLIAELHGPLRDRSNGD